MLSTNIISYGEAMRTPKTLVPYQRPYEWTRKNGKHFAKDMMSVMTGKEKECFLGSMTFLNTPHKIYLIDGGNRNISGLALIALLRNRATSLENKHDRTNKGNKFSYSIAVTAKNNMDNLLYKGLMKQIPLTIPNVTDKESKRFISYLRGMLIDDGTHHYTKFYDNKKKDSVYRLNCVHRELSRTLGLKLSNMNYSEQTQFLDNAYRRICNNIKIVKIVTSNRKEAQDIYESINSTGVQLAPQDLVKSYLASLLGKKSDVEMNRGMTKYVNMSSVFNNTKTIPNFLSCYVQAKFGQGTSKSLLVSRVDNNISTPSDAYIMIKETLFLAPLFKELINPKNIKRMRLPKLAKRNFILSTMGEHYYYDVILAMYHRSDVYTHNDIYNVFNTLLNISIQRSITHGNRPHFHHAAHDAWIHAPSVKQLRLDIIDENDKIQGQRYNPKQMCLSYNQPITRPGSIRFSTIAFIMANIYRYSSNDFEITNSIYNSLFKSRRNPSVVLMHLSEIVNGALVNSLGNDVLIESSLHPSSYKSLNSKLRLLSNSRFNYNRRLYNQISFALINKDISITDVIKKRQNKIANDFTKIWG